MSKNVFLRFFLKRYAKKWQLKFGLQSFKMTSQLRGVIRIVEMKSRPAVNTQILFCDHWWPVWGRPGMLARIPVDVTHERRRSTIRIDEPTYQVRVNQLRI
jgi:hypothetical protein